MMKKVIVFLLMIVLFGIFFAGEARISLTGNHVTWSQTLTFTVKHWIKVSWDYDTVIPIPIDELTYEANVGNITFQSNKAFKVYYTPLVLGEVTNVNISSVKIGSTVLSSNPQTPTLVGAKLLNGPIVIVFDASLKNVSEDFSIKYEFTFLPF